MTIYTDRRITTSDFDTVAASDKAFNEALLLNGFLKDRKIMDLRGGYYHPSCPNYSVDQVSGLVFDGLSDPARYNTIKISGNKITLPAVEDMIADRLASLESSGRKDQSRLKQARLMRRLAKNIDLVYLSKRVSEEGSDIALLEVV